MLSPKQKSPNRNDYKHTWTNLSQTSEQAMMSVAGHTNEDLIRSTAQHTRLVLAESVGLHPEDEILEIGCGVGRVGAELAPLCRHWTGCDVSPNMLTYARRRLASFNNVTLIEVSGFDLGPIPDSS